MVDVKLYEPFRTPEALERLLLSSPMTAGMLRCVFQIYLRICADLHLSMGFKATLADRGSRYPYTGHREYEHLLPATVLDCSLRLP